MRTLVVYVTHHWNINTEFFLEHNNNNYLDENVNFLLVLNNPTLQIPIILSEKVEVLRRENIGHDFGGWSIGLLENDRYLQYDKFILINSTVRGPFLPRWANKSWVGCFTNLIRGDVKLAGISIGHWDFQPHVQSMLLVTDRVGLEIGIRSGVFEASPRSLSKECIISEKEIGFSKHILKAGFNIDCLQKFFSGHDYRKDSPSLDRCVCFEDNSYFGTNIHPYETIFVKTSSYHFMHEVVNPLTKFHHERPSFADKSRRAYLNWYSSKINYEILENTLLEIEADSKVGHSISDVRNNSEAKVVEKILEIRNFTRSILSKNKVGYIILPNSSRFVDELWNLSIGVFFGYLLDRDIVLENPHQVLDIPFTQRLLSSGYDVQLSGLPIEDSQKEYFLTGDINLDLLQLSEIKNVSISVYRLERFNWKIGWFFQILSHLSSRYLRNSPDEKEEILRMFLKFDRK